MIIKGTTTMMRRMTMDRVLLTGGAMVAVGIVLAAAFMFVARYGATFEMLEDSVVRWLGKL
jgi:hypothetical protein